MIPTTFNTMGYGGNRGHIPLDYIESTGTQYIDTGILYDYSKNGVLHVEQYGYNPNSSGATFGARNINANNGLYVIKNVYNRTMGTSIASNGILYFVEQSWNTIEITPSNIYANGMKNNIYNQCTCEFPIYLFGLNHGGSLLVPASVKIRRCRYEENGVRKIDLTAAIDLNGNVGMYDTISGTFKYNSGTGDFIYG